MWRLPACLAGLFMTIPLLSSATDAGGGLVMVSCPGGAVALAKDASDVHCAGALRMPPGRIARVRSRGDREVARAWERDVARERRLEREIGELLERREAPRRAEPAPVLLSPLEYAELRRVAAVVHAPAVASIAYRHGDGIRDRLRFAHAPWLGARLREVMPLPGPVLVFELHRSPELAAVPVPSFAQGGVSFRPDPSDPSQLGWVASGASASPPGSPQLGYVVLPEGFDVERPLAIFWGDAVVATRAWTRP
jgi:hypothetical protein